jgi:hypothetical protein
LVGKHGAEALGIIDIAEGIAATVKIEYNSVPSLVPREKPSAFEILEGLAL